MAVAVVTGAARGIGRAIARRLAQDGFTVIAADIDAQDMAATTAALADEGLVVEPVGLDVSNRAGVAALFARLGKVDVVVNNAGVAAPLLGLAELTLAEVKRVFAVNVEGVFIVAQEAVRRMESGGRVVNIASRGHLGGAGAAQYVSSKAAVVGLTRAMAVELRWAGITVNAVAPGMVATRMLDEFTPETRRALERREPSGGAADASAIAAVVSFLASADSGFVNGQVLLADGGKSLGVPAL